MAKESKGKAKMSSEHYERSEGKLGPTCNERYAGEIDNPREMDQRSEGLASYVKKHKVKH